MRRRGIVMLTEEGLHYLLALEPGERVVGSFSVPIRNAIAIAVEGDETSSIPETAPGTDAATIVRPYALHRLRDRLAEIMSEGWCATHSLDEYYRAIGQAVEREVWPHLQRPVP